jgi:dUTP pyrophosphatase
MKNGAIKYFKEFNLYIITDTMSTLVVQKMHADAIIPTKGTTLSTGYDLFSCIDCVVHEGKRFVVPTGIRIKIPEGCYGRIASRSGNTVKHGVEVGAGVIDRDYEGEIRVVLFNHGNRPFHIRQGYRVAQIIMEKYEDVQIQEDPELYPQIPIQG